MNWRTTGILFVLLLAVGTFAWFTSRDAGQLEPPPTPLVTPQVSLPLLSQITVQNLQQVSLANNITAESRVFVHSGDTVWSSITPDVDGVPESLSQTLAFMVENFASRRQFGPNENELAAYGLDVPPYSLELSAVVAGAPEIIAIDIGSQTPTQNGYYVRLAGDDRIHVVPKTSLDELFAMLPMPEEE